MWMNQEIVVWNFTFGTPFGGIAYPWSRGGSAREFLKHLRCRRGFSAFCVRTSSVARILSFYLHMVTGWLSKWDEWKLKVEGNMCFNILIQNLFQFLPKNACKIALSSFNLPRSKKKINLLIIYCFKAHDSFLLMQPGRTSVIIFLTLLHKGDLI